MHPTVCRMTSSSASRPTCWTEHIAVDIGVAEVGALMAQRPGIAAFQGGVSRLVCDFNRDEHLPTVVPIASDGHAIPGNALDHAGHEARLARFFRPYHDADEARPWQIGILYNQDDRAARQAIPALSALGLCVGDQQPYSGKLLNATMNRHGEANGISYLGIEMRQDLISDAAGVAHWCATLAPVISGLSL